MIKKNDMTSSVASISVFVGYVGSARSVACIKKLVSKPRCKKPQFRVFEGREPFVDQKLLQSDAAKEFRQSLAQIRMKRRMTMIQMYTFEIKESTDIGIKYVEKLEYVPSKSKSVR
jgi:hypothetical protein